MKRIVTAVDENGHSHIASLTELDSAQGTTLWEYDPVDIAETIAAIDPAHAADWIGPSAANGVIWRYTPMLPASESTHISRPGMDENGFHTSRTIDFDIILEGHLTLILDRDSIQLERGDVVIQQATRHAWKNESKTTSVLLALIHRPTRSSEQAPR